MLIDSVLYHFATRIVLEEDIGPVCDSFPTETVAKYIEVLETEGQKDYTESKLLPVIGRIPPALFLLIYQVTWLSRQLPFFTDQNHRLAVQCLSELNVMEELQPSLGYNAQTDKLSQATNSDIAGMLYLLSLKIYLAKVLDPHHVTTGCSWLGSHTIAADNLLAAFDGTIPCGQFICWTILVLGCAACPTTVSEVTNPSTCEGHHLRARIRNRIQELLLQIWKVSYSGYVRRVASALERIWSLPASLARIYPTDAAICPEQEYDGLQALTHKYGAGTGLG
jgi:hypothetical protein